jgi:hypothetical protein
MENLMVIPVEVIAPVKPLDIKRSLNIDYNICKRLEIAFCKYDQ